MHKAEGTLVTMEKIMTGFEIIFFMFRMDWNSESGEVKRNLRKYQIGGERQRWGNNFGLRKLLN